MQKAGKHRMPDANSVTNQNNCSKRKFSSSGETCLVLSHWRNSWSRADVHLRNSAPSCHCLSSQIPLNGWAQGHNSGKCGHILSLWLKSTFRARSLHNKLIGFGLGKRNEPLAHQQQKPAPGVSKVSSQLPRPGTEGQDSSAHDACVRAWML